MHDAFVEKLRLLHVLIEEIAMRNMMVAIVQKL